MKNKKTPSANLENKRLIFFQIGIILTLSAVLTAFEWRSYDEYSIEIPKSKSYFVEEPDIPITKIPKKPIPKPPVYTVINLLHDDSHLIPDDLDNLPWDIKETTQIEPYVGEMPEDKIDEEPLPPVNLDKMPEFPGGYDALLKYLAKNLRYPLMAIEAGIQGRVFLSFVVEKDGSITDIKVVRGIGGGCSEEAIRVVTMMPRWSPGIQHLRPVRVKYTLPVNFVLK